MNRLFVAIDGNSLMHRAFHAIAELDDGKGNPTNAIYGFTGMLLKVLKDYEPSHLAVAFDMHGPTFRHLAYEAYKGTRKPTDETLRPQFPRVKELLRAMGATIIEVPSFEADDILGTLARKCEEAGMPAMIVTGDRDSLQLVTETTHVLYTRRGISDTVEFDPETVRAQYGVTPAQVPDLKGLMGDASDNIPGVPGVGEKTALKLLDEYGSVECVLEHASEQKGKLREKLEAGRESAEKSKWLATISREAPLEVTLDDCRLGDLSGAKEAFEELAFRSLEGRLEAVAAARRETAPTEAPAPAPQINFGEEAQLTAIEEIAAWVDGVDECALCAGESVTLACRKGCARVTLAGDLLSPGLDEADVYAALAPLFQKKNCLRLWGAKALLRALDAKGFSFDPACVRDDALLSDWLLDPLKSAKERKFDGGAADLWRLCDEHNAALEAEGMTALYREMELPLMGVLLSMEREGFMVDRKFLEEMGVELTAAETRLREEIIAETGGVPFNLNSTRQLGEVLFERLKLPSGRKTSRGWSTDADTLESLRGQHPAIEKLLEYRRVTKLNATYIVGLTEKIDRDGRVRSLFDQTATVTGRLSSNEPNLQNIPVRTEEGRRIRRAFIARPGWLLVDADYSQIELRILAHLSGDENMIDAFVKGQDIHARTAAEVYGVPLEAVTPQMRSASKAVNFGIVYGISDFGLARNIGVSRKEAAEFIERYFARYPGVKRFMDSAVADGKALGYAQTMFGRRRPLPELQSSNYNVRSFGERAAMNTPVQGAAADIIKLAMVRVFEALRAEKMRSRLILQVHDELIVECPPEEAGRAQALLTDCMENVTTLKVPLRADAHCAESWFDAK